MIYGQIRPIQMVFKEFNLTRPANVGPRRVRGLPAFFLFTLCVSSLIMPLTASAWGTEGHRIVGVNALAMLDDSARAAVVEILGGDSDELIGKACFWPDTVREIPEWEWSAPMHYVNIPRSARHFDRERDCGDGMCVTAAIVKYANELSRPELDAERRWQAFAWLCHLVGDLHQPLHAGYRDDLGGNTVNVEYRGKTGNLHQFWDRVVIHDRLGVNDLWEKPLSGTPWNSVASDWNPDSVACWANESHALVATSAYPSGFMIDEPFADQTWLIIREQWQKASNRLARVLNATVGNGITDP
jgi:hypothetical protein